MKIKYLIKTTDPDGNPRRFLIYSVLPVQKFVRGVWEVTVTRIIRKDIGTPNQLAVDKVDWQLLPIGDSK